MQNPLDCHPVNQRLAYDVIWEVVTQEVSKVEVSFLLLNRLQMKCFCELDEGIQLTHLSLEASHALSE